MNFRPLSGNLPFEYAASRGYDKCMKKLLDVGAGVKQTTVLMSAVENGHKECVEPLVNAGADVNIKRPKDSFSVLQVAARRDSDTCVNLLIKAGADVTASSDGANSALIEALRCGHQNSVNLLLKAGADVNVTNLYEETPIIMAAKTRNGCQSLEALIKAGARCEHLRP